VLTDRLLSRSEFDRIYNSSIVGAGFFEKDDYYRFDKERYWRSLQFLITLPIPRPAKILEIGGGQIAVLCSSLFKDECVVGDISDEFSAPLQRARVPTIRCNLMDDEFAAADEQFDAVVCLEVIEHLPVPPYVIFKKLQKFLRPGGVLFLTTPNLFRLRNLIRMFLGKEFLDRFMLPQAEQGLGHQLEYSADHLRWQIEQSGMEVLLLAHDELGRIGHSPKAQLARRLLFPLTMRPIWRDGLVAAAQKRTA
jgi:SAM-dependent methyltransferase